MSINIIFASNETLAEKIKKQGYFLTPEDVEGIIPISRLMPVLVRCNGGRFTCPAQCALHFCKIIGNSGKDYVRDISLINS